MGYYSTVTGEITVTPPIPWGEIEGTPFDGADKYAREIKPRCVEETRTEGEWQMTRKVVAAVVPTWDGQFKAYHLTEHLQDFVTRFGKGRTFAGRLDIKGEDAGDLWRLVVRDGLAVEVKPVITWPDEGGSP